MRESQLADHTELRFAKPSFRMRLAGWLIGRRGSEFDDPVALHDEVPHRDPPKDAPMPANFETQFGVERWSAEGQQLVTLHPKSSGPKSGKGEWHILYFHGGGFFLPMFKEHWPLVAEMIAATGASITVPLYSVVPESDHQPATALADAAYDRIAQQWDASRIALSGDSAGGNFALALAMRLRDENKPAPGRLILFAPWLDLTLADPAAREVEEHDVMLKVDSLRVMGEWWAGKRDPKDPQCSPYYGDLAGLPPMEIYQGRYDIFVVDSRAFTARAAAENVAVKLYEYEGAPHVFMALTFSAEAKDTFAQVAKFLSPEYDVKY